MFNNEEYNLAFMLLAQWPNGRASVYESRGPGLKPVPTDAIIELPHQKTNNLLYAKKKVQPE